MSSVRLAIFISIAVAFLSLGVTVDRAAAQQSPKIRSVKLNSLSKPQVEGAVRFQVLNVEGRSNPTLRLCRKGCPQKLLLVVGQRLPALVPGQWYDLKAVQWKGKLWVVGGKRVEPPPSATPTSAPLIVPTAAPTVTPTATPTVTPTVTRTATPTATRTARPTATPTTVPTMVPTATSTPADPLAFDFSATGHGMESVAVILKADPGEAGAAITCRVTGVPADVSLQPIRECQYLLAPSGRGHRGPDVEFSFTVTRATDGRTSAPAKIRVGWTQDGSFIGDHFSLAPYRDSLTREEAYYLIRTTSFGDRMPELVELAMQSGGLDKVVDRILTVEDTAQCKAIEQAAQSFADRDRTPICNNFTLTSPTGTAVSVPFCAPSSPTNSLITANAVALRWVFALRYGCNPFRERVALLWHNHFATNLYDIGISGGTSTRSHYTEQHVATLRALDRSNSFMPIDQIVSRMHGADGAMGVWLDNRRNERFGGGNENYARELLELFTLGVRDIVRGSTNYNESDIYDFRQALMGYSDETAADTITKRTLTGVCDAKCASDACKACALLPVDGANGQTREIVEKVTNPHFYPLRWNFPTQPGQVVLFDGTPWSKRAAFKADTFSTGGDTLTPYLMNSHPGVSRFFAARLLTTFVTLEPSDEMVSTVADALVKSSWDPAPVLRMLLRSSAFYAKENRYDGFNNPIEHLITFMRALGLPADRAMTVQEQACPNNPAQTCFLDITQRVLTWINLEGYPLLRMPSVFGLPEIGKITGNRIHNGSVFLTAQRFLERLKAVPDILNFVSANIKNSKTTFTWQELLPTADKQRSPDAVLDHICARLGLSITDQQRVLLIDYLSNVTPRTVTKDGILDADPAYKRSVNWQSLTADQFNALMELKIPGLLTILAALPQSQFR